MRTSARTVVTFAILSMGTTMGTTAVAKDVIDEGESLAPARR